MNKPVYIGQAILDLSKTLMYEIYYEYIRPKYGSRAKLCYMVTDSFVREIETEDFYRDITKDVEKSLIRVDIQRMITGHYPPEKIKR